MIFHLPRTGPTLPALPELPKLPTPPLVSPFRFVPEKVTTSVIVHTLNRLLTPALDEDELDFLDGESVSVEVTDLELRFALTLDQGSLTAGVWKQNDALNLSGETYDYLLLATRTEDADTLFFQRKLKMSGDTELGLEVKNLLDGLDTEAVRFHKQIDAVLKAALKLQQRFRADS